MKLRVIVSIFFVFAMFCGFTQTTSAKIKLTNKDKREIIKQILQEMNFSHALKYVPDGVLFISTENIPTAIQKNPPKIKGVKFQFLTPEEIGKSVVKVSYFVFVEFQKRRKSVQIWFTETNSPTGVGRGYICMKVKGKWKIRVNKFILGMV